MLGFTSMFAVTFTLQGFGALQCFTFFVLPFRCRDRLLTAYFIFLVMLRSAHTPSLTLLPIPFKVEDVSEAQRKVEDVSEAQRKDSNIDVKGEGGRSRL